MGIFATRVRPAPPAHPEAGAELTEDLRAALPPRFEAVGEALACGMGSVDICAAVGQSLAQDGVPLDEALDGLEATYRLVRATLPDHAATRALAGAWGEATLGYLHRLTCEDPVTGLASLAHLQSRLSELYRGELRGGRPGASHALVVIDLPRPVEGPVEEATDLLAADLRVLGSAEVVRTVFDGDETIARVARDRVVVLGHRDAGLGRRVALARRMLGRLRGGPPVRLRVEGLPPAAAGAATLLDELARL